MQGTRLDGENHIYLDENLDGFSNVAAGLMARAIGHGLKVAYVDSSNTGIKYTNFLENISLNYSFVKKLGSFYVETFTFKSKDMISRAILPDVEFHNVDAKIFWDSIKAFDLVVFDNANIDVLGKFKIINSLKNRPVNQEVVFVLADKKNFEDLKEYFSLASHYNCKSKKNLMTSKIHAVTGNGKGKSTYGFGFLLRKYISKDDVKLIYFDKGGDFYGERNFFDALKLWSLNNNLYGKFDYVPTGLQRFDGKRFRFENNDNDIIEAKEGLKLLKTALKKKSFVVADELNTVVKTGLVKLEDVRDVLEVVDYDFVMTGRYLEKEIFDIASIVVEVDEIMHYASNGKGVRRGIDF